jgi:monoterpene epsilon-lactone hydrolase
MTTREAGMSSSATSLYRQLLEQGVEVPRLDTLDDYREALQTDSAADIQTAVSAFDGVIEMIDIAGISCRQLTPRGWNGIQDNCILYAYGGGYVSGSTSEDQVITAPLAQHSGARIIMVEYRLSPEYPYPGPQQDMRQVYAALLDQYGAARLIVSGESAGGNQALSLMQHARDSGLALPRCAVLFSPWCDLANQGDSHIFNDSRDPTLNNAWVDIAASWHAGDCALDDPGLSPIHGDMRGLPPCIITTGSRDLLLSQCLRLAAKLHAVGVECDLRVWEGLWHVFEFYPIPEAQLSIVEIAAYIRAH